MINLNGKTVLITGASRGIGEAAAQTFIEAGANVMLTARNLSKLETRKKDFYFFSLRRNWYLVENNIYERFQ